MTTTTRSTSALLLLPALLLASSAFAQTAAPADAPGTVVVSGQRQGAGDPHQVNAARDKLLNGRSASSCAFMDPRNPKFDPVYTRYMSDFGLDDSLSDDVLHVSDLAPGGDVSNTIDSSGIPSAAVSPALAGAATPGCGPADLRFAAGRNAIARKDRSLAFGYEAFDNKDYPRALDQFTLAWNKVGYDEAALMLARLHLYGLGTPKDGAKAVTWLDKVVNGRFDPQTDPLRFDPAQPRLTTAKVDAAFMLARMYERGIGVVRDQHKANALYAKAAEFGFVPALDILGERELAGAGTARDPAAAVAHLKQAADAGYAPAQFHLARAYYSGDGMPKNLELAGAYFDAAAHAGLPAAMFAAGRMLDLGEGVKPDPSRALVYYKDAALKGDPDAQFALGTYFYSGEVVGKDLAVARKWFDAAARRGQADAMFNLGVMAAKGEGGAKDPAVAYVWLALAAQSGQKEAGAARDMLAPSLSAEQRKRAEAVLAPKVAGAQ
jgi:TPR repeat protein